MTQEKGLTTTGRGELVHHEAQPLIVSPQYVENQVRSLDVLRTMVQKVLVEDRDYGHIPGVRGKSLWDPGAAMIISAFNCHAGQRRLLHLVDDGTKIAIVVEVPIINNQTGMEVGSGVGASSTMESKHHYRWVTNPVEWGYGEEAAKTLKTRKDKESGQTEYRIVNPEHDELLNVIIKQASKRAETDAAVSLPGAAAALRELLDKNTPRPKAGAPASAPGVPGDPQQDGIESPRWTTFHNQRRALGLSESQVHRALKVKSMKDWIKAGKSLDDAIRHLSELLAQGLIMTWDGVQAEHIKDFNALEKIYSYLTDKPGEELYKEFGSTKEDAQLITKPWEAFLTLKELNNAPPSSG